MAETKNRPTMNDTIFNRSLKKLEGVNDDSFKKISNKIYWSLVINLVLILVMYFCGLIYWKNVDLRLLLTLFNLLFIVFLGIQLSALNSLKKHENLVDEVAVLIITSIPSDDSDSKKVFNVFGERIFDILEQEIANYEKDVFRFPKIIIVLSGSVTFFLKSGMFYLILGPDFISWVIVLLALFPLILSEIYKELIKINILKEAVRVAQFKVYAKNGNNPSIEDDVPSARSKSAETT
ncbi:hypothetical protein ATX28_09230 [Oenococcus oeni]|uniref:hypothetical protein n=1 Tax=Oenococcus oeni TaxID=1247 RepID=UPI00095264D5|nr:hypothetical protein [Oenococcus oeni]OLQ38387.1 hypothetical protein ATX28_09230 [Oenococcus oeni]